MLCGDSVLSIWCRARMHMQRLLHQVAALFPGLHRVSACLRCDEGRVPTATCPPCLLTAHARGPRALPVSASLRVVLSARPLHPVPLLHHSLVRDHPCHHYLILSRAASVAVSLVTARASEARSGVGSPAAPHASSYTPDYTHGPLHSAPCKYAMQLHQSRAGQYSLSCVFVPT